MFRQWPQDGSFEVFRDHCIPYPLNAIPDEVAREVDNVTFGTGRPGLCCCPQHPEGSSAEESCRLG
jgi:hypothetical protein